MDKLIILIIISVFQIIRALFLIQRGRDTKFLWISFFLLSVPLDIKMVLGNRLSAINTGTLSPFFSLSLPIMMCGLFVILYKKYINITITLNHWVTYLIALAIISILNPFCPNINGPLIFIIFFIPLIILFKLFGDIISLNEIIKGIFDGFSILCFVQFCLAICFPVLGLLNVTTLFHPESKAWATREGTRIGAVGIFPTPGALSLFMLIASSFFISTFLFNYNKRQSFIILFLNIITVILTYSRTSYISFILLIFFLIFIKRNSTKNFLSFNILKFILPAILAMGWLILFSPLSKIFLKSDANNQFNNRTTFFRIAYDIFKKSPIIGVGLNSEVAYTNRHEAIVYDAVVKTIGSNHDALDFFETNPIHNIHLLVLSETGMLGLGLWLIFIIKNVILSKKQIANNQNQILSLTFIGVLFSFSLYGLTGWAPLSEGIFPFFLMVAYLAIRYRYTITVRLKFNHDIPSPLSKAIDNLNG